MAHHTPGISPEWIRGMMRGLTGREYRIDLGKLDAESLREFQRFLSDVTYEKNSAVSRERARWWRPTI